MEEQLDKLISLMEVQNKAWERSLRLLNEIHALMVEKYKGPELLLEKHPAIRAPGAPLPVDERAAAARTPGVFNEFAQDTPYGYELEEEAAPMPHSFPVPPNARTEERTHQTQLPFKEKVPEVPLTSKAEMMERVEKQDTSRGESA